MLGGVLTFAVAFAASCGLTVPIRRMALHWGIVDVPNARKIHRTPIPLLGGVAIYLGTVLSIVWFVESPARGQIFGILAASTLLLVVGILDDRHLLHHQIKLFVAMPLAALTLVALGVKTHVGSALLPGPVGPILDIGLTLFWVVGITAAYNIFDHMDGLASGVTAIASLFFTILAIREGQVLVATLGAALLGGSLGFLLWNFNPAKIFMGDGGAMFLGFMVATLGLKLRLHERAGGHELDDPRAAPDRPDLRHDAGFHLASAPRTDSLCQPRQRSHCPPFGECWPRAAWSGLGALRRGICRRSPRFAGLRVIREDRLDFGLGCDVSGADSRVDPGAVSL